ncbi:Cell division and transport-associated protein TolQ [Novosphingobium aromaticivorans DSM 12444]|uniref:Cell division and transport-associated protein TolQ n=1 Tax=Novosphingobium aromaticivorans (strain ATCC 700278 / DSM 12444 / CCUG 56034 / CIP 105152 / NBRC 16084 / F199) TaxID=279238 RepID=Q2G9L4_NOVAD|nr:protein TolQ [Novosphingobium aromaticivorans]ABD25459.1 Cell division and transport-associated protein TolQ [Novosphingobium aromaticivorans DSM 12444]SCX94298.1 Cell division and transport-associated protein TolQ [Novosphingobium aromaticivorans]
MTLQMLANGVSFAPTSLNPVQLFLDADYVVQAVMAGLVLASIWTWTIIIGFSLKMGSVQRGCDAYEREFWEARDIDQFHKDNKGKDLPSVRVVAAALTEWRRSTSGSAIDRDGTRQRLTTALDGAVVAETDALASRLNFLATVGSVAPFVGLFGTVWGIMDSFFNIGAQQNSSLAVVAPGISEALFATAIGLFAAIPAVIAYNRFSHRVNRFETRLYRFADRFHASLSRELEV